MRILMINKFLYPNGGSETYIFKLGEALEQHGHEVQYFGMEHEGRCVGNRINAGYVYRDMWAGPPQENGTCDVEDSVTGLIRTEGPTISFNGAWAQNIDEEGLFIDFMGNQGGIRLQYGQDFTFYTTRYGALVKEKPEFKPNNMYEAEIDAFVRCIRTGEKQPNHIDVFLRTQKLLEDIYRSAALHREIAAETEEAP